MERSAKSIFFDPGMSTTVRVLGYGDLVREGDAGTEIVLACACSLPISPATSLLRSSGVFPTALTASGIAVAMRAAATAIAGDVTVMDRDDKLSAASATRTPASVCAA
jgi:hypothetical protein